jgi:hypothetical protein
MKEASWERESVHPAPVQGDGGLARGVSSTAQRTAPEQDWFSQYPAEHEFLVLGILQLMDEADLRTDTLLSPPSHNPLAPYQTAPGLPLDQSNPLQATKPRA